MAWDGQDTLRAALRPPGAKAEFARQMGVRADTVTRWLGTSSRRPADDDLAKMEQVLELNPGDLGRANWRAEAAVLREHLRLLTIEVIRLGRAVGAPVSAEVERSLAQRPPGPQRRRSSGAARPAVR